MPADLAAASDQPQAQFFSPFGVVGAPEALRASVNDKITLIEGMAELLLDADGEVDRRVGRAALEAIARNAAALRLLLSPPRAE